MNVPSQTSKWIGPKLHRRQPYPASAQSGYALVFALIILLILTILGVTVMNMSGLEFKMAGNTQEFVRAFQVAESGNSQAIADEPTYAVFDTQKTENVTTNIGSIPIGSSTATIKGSLGCLSCSPGRSSKSGSIQSARQQGDGGSVKYTTFQISTIGTTPFGTTAEILQNVKRPTR